MILYYSSMTLWNVLPVSPEDGTGAIEGLTTATTPLLKALERNKIKAIIHE